MSTNYYFKPEQSNPLAIFGDIHLGKSSGGWTFSFHGYNVVEGYCNVGVGSGLSVNVFLPELIVRDYKDVVNLLKSGGVIHNEYMARVTLEEFEKMVKDKSGKNHARSFPRDDSWLDAEDNSFGDYEFS